jgi:hypothetical protein
MMRSMAASAPRELTPVLHGGDGRSAAHWNARRACSVVSLLLEALTRSGIQKRFELCVTATLAAKFKIQRPMCFAQMKHVSSYTCTRSAAPATSAGDGGEHRLRRTLTFEMMLPRSSGSAFCSLAR